MHVHSGVARGTVSLICDEDQAPITCLNNMHIVCTKGRHLLHDACSMAQIELQHQGRHKLRGVVTDVCDDEPCADHTRRHVRSEKFHIMRAPGHYLAHEVESRAVRAEREQAAASNKCALSKPRGHSKHELAFGSTVCANSDAPSTGSVIHG
eukprot:CAMPEP_0185197818 /NCGR_PEP_ID=MMETSP1140-20130426/41364_1 /TAXON_ID=298111 /ORGANISM="Pavlova sp., Strain CCMP459" /LENGTH=151 /DNA_ID=CAMNT_0027764961 /DNA_START=274 /DNA_END=727 /DNA_ORIENTATION=+